jgi:hypothetical protein
VSGLAERSRNLTSTFFPVNDEEPQRRSEPVVAADARRPPCRFPIAIGPARLHFALAPNAGGISTICEHELELHHGNRAGESC